MADQFSKMYDVERVGGDQRQRLAEMLRANAMNTPQGQMVSGWYVPPSLTQNLAHMANTAVGVFGGLALDKERKETAARLLREMTEGVPTDEGKLASIPGLTPVQVQGQSMPDSVQQTPINQAMVQAPKMRQLTEDEKLGKAMELAQIDPYAAQMWSTRDAARQARLLRLEDLAEKRAYEEKKDERERQWRREDKMLFAGLGRQPQAPVAVIDPQTGQEVYVAPSQAYGMRPAKSMQPLSVAQQKEVLEADEVAQSSQNVINTLEAAKKLNPVAYSGVGAKERALIRSNIPFMGQSKEADATIQLENMTLGTALENLKSIFGGNPTEGERKILIDLQASPSKTVEQRAEILDRAKTAAENRLRFNVQKAEAIRGGSYMKPGYSPVTAPQQSNGMPSQSAIDAEIERRRQGR